jgi:hypothetical protein
MNIISKLNIKPGAYLYMVFEPETDHVGSEKIYVGGITYRPIGDRQIHTVDEAILIRQEIMEAVADAFPETITKRKIIGMSYVIAYEFGWEESPMNKTESPS